MSDNDDLSIFLEQLARDMAGRVMLRLRDVGLTPVLSKIETGEVKSSHNKRQRWLSKTAIISAPPVEIRINISIGASASPIFMTAWAYENGIGKLLLTKNCDIEAVDGLMAAAEESANVLFHR